MTNPYAPVAANSSSQGQRNLALLASIALAALCFVAFSLDAFAVITYAFQSGDTSTLSALWVDAVLLGASLFLVRFEIGASKRLATAAAFVVIPLFLYSVYLGIQIASSYTEVLKILKAQPTIAIGLMLVPMIWLYTGLFAIRAASIGTTPKNE